ncbi:tetratricopeptide repeat protein [Nitrococcus mobilis]|uniref:Uncharacterized protein n=1 Tax=Nitrococcus mobilis Nb-231 TaxID=314278 RepID=A4BRL4_9GAMM|nr:tetratricopeptide repeat protein [Nitrococcus mobilis]EAR21585.1 hypothetical protein NB231_02423 [Nitrococcus mobilis Nb-231]
MRRIFLSAVTGEFGSHRRMLKADLSLPRVKVQEQTDLVQGEGKLLQTLDTYIRDHCDALLHLVGRQGGQTLKPDELRWLLDSYDDFPARFPFLAPALHASPPALTYTQLEAWLALYHGKRCHLYRPGDWDQNPLPRDHPQQRHWKWLAGLGEHYSTFDDEQHLCRHVLRDLHNLWPEEIPAQHRPIALPYSSLGTLFKGREAVLQQLRASLTKSTGQATALVGKAMHGLGGVGKTRLAVEYAWQHADEYSAVLFVTADSPASLQRNLAELTGPRVLNLPERESPEEAVQMAAALRWLNTHPGWFLILDNVDTEAAAAYAEDLLTRLQGGQVLITSRLARWGGHVEPVELDVLQEDAAAAFLLERTRPQSGCRGRQPRPDDDQRAAALARELAGLALALEQAGAYITAQRISLADYLRRWQAHDKQVQTWHRAREMQYPRSLAVTWQTTLEQLGPGEVALLNILAWFAPEPIPLFVLGLPYAEAAFDPAENSEDAKVAEKIAVLWREAAARLSNAEPPAGSSGNGERTDPSAQAGQASLREALATLTDYSLIRWEVAADTVAIHRVVQEILRTSQPAAVQWLTSALKLLDEALPPGNPWDVHTWPRWEPLRAHIAFAAAKADWRDIAEPTGLFINRLALLLHAKALHAEAEPLFRRALAIGEAVYGPEHPAVATGLNNLAGLLQATNRLAEAEPLFRRALAIDEAAYGSEHPEAATGLNNLAELLRATNRLAEAEPLYRRALAINEAAYGSEYPAVARDLNNLAELLRVTNRLAEAEPLYRRALAINEAAYGSEHPEAATGLNNLAELLRATNRLAEAEPLYRRALAIDEAAYGSEHPEAATGLNNLAELLRATNRLAEAEPLYRRALAIREAAYGPEHPHVAHGLNNLALLLKDGHRLVEAEPLMCRMAAIFYRYQQMTGYAHPYMQTDLENYRSLLKALSVPSDGITEQIQAVMQTPGPLEPITLHLEGLLGPSQLDVPLDQPVASHLEKLLGPAPSTQDVLDTLERQYREQGKPAVWFLPLDEPISPHLDELLKTDQ